MTEDLAPVPWEEQPQHAVLLNAASDLTKGLTDVFTGSNIGFNHATGQTTPITAGGSGYSSRAVQGGKSLYTPNGGWADITINRDWSGPNTIVALAVVRGVDSNFGGLFAKNAATTDLQIGVGRQSTGNNWYGSVENAVTSAISGSSITGVTGVLSLMTFTHTGVNATPMTYYVNGLLVGSSGNLGPQNAGVGPLGLGRERSGSASFDSDVDWILFARYNRVLSANDIKRLAANPWQIFAPLPARPYLVGPGGGAANYTLTCAVGAYVYAGQAATLSLARKLPLAAGAYTYVGNAATLTYSPGLGPTNYTLTCAAGAYAYAGNAATLKVARNLALAAGAYSYIGNAATLTYSPGGVPVNYTLVCAAGAYAYAGNAATLTYVNKAVSTKIGGDDGFERNPNREERIEIYEPRRKPKRRDEELDTALQAAFNKVMGREPIKVVRAVELPDDDEDELELLLALL